MPADRRVLDSLLRRRPGIRYQGPDPADFRAVVLVSPIWMYRLAGPMRSFVVDGPHRLNAGLSKAGPAIPVCGSCGQGAAPGGGKSQ